VAVSGLAHYRKPNQEINA